MDFVEIEYKERETDWAMSDLQSHDYYELYFLLEGSRDFFFEDRMFNLNVPTFCVIPPFSMHKTSGGNYKRVNINVSTQLLTHTEKEMLDHASEYVAFPLDRERSNTLIELLKSGSNITLIDPAEKQQLAAAITHTVLHLLGNIIGAPLGYNRIANKKKYDTQMLEVVSYINQFYREPLTLQKISERFYISKNTLCKRFKAAMRCSVIEYLSFVRINRAKELLTTTSKSMEEISELCGYSSANYFSLAFKGTVGISPTDYKKTK